jgi:IPT/TIG domain/PASTA domain
MRGFLRLQVLWVLLGAPLVLATGATAQTYRFGSTMAMTKSTMPAFIDQGASEFNGAVEKATSPATGAVVGWNVRDSRGGPLYLRVLHRGAAVDQYVVGSQSAAAFPGTTGVEHFTTDLPIKAGDTIGIEGVGEATVGQSLEGLPGNSEAVRSVIEGTVATAEPEPDLNDIFPEFTKFYPEYTGLEQLFDAEVQVSPTLSGVGPTVGSAAGGTQVVIGGYSLERVQSVTFGGIPASFEELSENYLGVYTPANTPGVGVPVTVKTAAGTVTAPEQFVYQPLPASPGDPEDPAGPSKPGAPTGPSPVEEEELTPAAIPPPATNVTPSTSSAVSGTPAASTLPSGQAAGSAWCIVPKLSGKSLKATETKIEGADCRLGKVTRLKGATARSGKILGQSEKPGSVLPAGAVVKVTLGKG